jgi:hypothetical protein
LGLNLQGHRTEARRSAFHGRRLVVCGLNDTPALQRTLFKICAIAPGGGARVGRAGDRPWRRSGCCGLTDGRGCRGDLFALRRRGGGRLIGLGLFGLGLFGCGALEGAPEFKAPGASGAVIWTGRLH